MTDSALAFLDVDSEAARLIAERDWSGSLGPIEGWPVAMRSVVALILRSPIPMVLLWGKDGVLLYNDGYAAFSGDRHPSLLGARVREGWPEIADFNDNILKIGLAGGVLSLKDQELPLKRGGRADSAWMDLDYTPVLGDDGRPGGVLCIVVETTSRVLAQRQMAEAQARLKFLDDLNRATLASRDADEILAVTTRMTAQHMGASVCAYADMDADQDGFTIRGDWAAPGSTSIVGHYSLADFGALAVQELGAGRPLIINDNLKEIAPDEAATFQAIGISATTCMPLVTDGRLTALMAVHHREPHVWTDSELALIREVTERSWANIERVRADAARADSESRYRALFDAIDEGFCIVEFFDGPHGPLSDYIHIEANPAYAKEAGIPDVVGKTLRGMVGAEADAWVARYRPVLITGEPIRFEQELVETGRWLELAAFRIEPPERKQVAVLFKDLTERRRAELALRESEAQFRSLARALPNQVWMAGPDGVSNWFNERVYQYTGAEDGALDRDVWRRLIHPDDWQTATDAWADAVASSQTYLAELRLRRADGVWRWHQSRAVPLLDDQGAVVRWVGSNTDIDDQRAIAEALGDVNAVLEQRVTERTDELMRTQDALRQAQKMEAVGQLTGGIAHDFNNLLAGISGSLELIEKRIGEGRTIGLERYIDGAQGAARRAAALTQRLLAFSRRQTLDPKPTDVNRLISGMEDLIRRSVGPAVTMEVVGAGGLWATRIDPSQLENALLNLCINARDAMAPEG
ncbi:MAG: PAS domain S-box protein, partial [Brevundimonas sp.]